MRDYELVMVVDPEVGDEGLPGTVERVHGFIQERGGEIKNVDQWGRRRLAYPIRRRQEAYYVITHFSLEPQAIRALEGSLDLAEDVLRHLVTRIEEVKEAKPKKAKVSEVA
ncbi:MAG TPA: 30S ribosomal protein S6 [Dehalococcoidia bacterium]|nr:30S ribosomal protein S6 [Dehalococcoidia bacterium]